MSKLLIFDADSIIFTVAWHYRTKKVPNMVKMATNKFVSDVLRHANADDYMGFYAAKDEEDEANIKPNFRYAVYDKYKANRPETPEFVKKWRPVIHNEFKQTWGFMPVEGIEADDAVAISVEKYRNSYDEIIVATFDKDLKTIPNITYYYMKEHTMTKISKFDAVKHFCTQMIMGDSADNVPGIPGIGEKGAEKLLKDCTTEYGLFKEVVKAYKSVASKAENAELAIIKKEIEAFQNNPDSDQSDSPYKGLKGAKLLRKMRIVSKQRLKDKVNEVMPGGWKAYFRQQYTLLKMLTVEPDYMTIPDTKASPVKQDLSQSAEDAIEAVFGEHDDSIDDFLTI